MLAADAVAGKREIVNRTVTVWIGLALFLASGLGVLVTQIARGRASSASLRCLKGDARGGVLVHTLVLALPAEAAGGVLYFGAVRHRADRAAVDTSTAASSMHRRCRCSWQSPCSASRSSRSPPPSPSWVSAKNDQRSRPTGRQSGAGRSTRVKPHGLHPAPPCGRRGPGRPHRAWTRCRRPSNARCCSGTAAPTAIKCRS